MTVGDLVAYLRIDDTQFRSRLAASRGELADFGGRLSGITGVVSAVGPALGAAASAASAAAAGFSALAGAVGPAVGIVAAYPVAFLAAQQAMGVVKFAMDGVTEAAQKLGEAGDDPKKLAAALEGLSPAAAEMARSLAATKPVIDDLRASAQAGLFPGLTEAMSEITGLAPQLRDELQSTGGALGGLATNASGLASTELPAIQRIMAGNIPLITTMGEVVLTLASGLLRVVEAAQPMTQQLAEAALAGAEFVTAAATAGQESGRLGAFFQSAYDTAAQLGRILVDVGAALYNVFSTGASTGQGLLTVLEQGAQHFRDWTTSAAGIAALGRWFDDGRRNIEAMGLVIAAVQRNLAGLGSSDMLAPLLAQIAAPGGLIDSLGQLVENASASGALGALVDAITRVVQALATMEGSDSSLKAFAVTLGAFATAAQWVLENVPGASTALGAFFIVAGASKAASLVGLGSAVQLLGTALAGLAATAITAAASWALSMMGIQTAAGASMGSVLASLAMAAYTWAATWIMMAASAVAGAASIAASWVVATGSAMASAIASTVVAVATSIAGWVSMAATALASAASIAVAWLIAIGPIALVIAAVVGLVVVIVNNWDAIQAATLAVWDWVVAKLQTVFDWIKTAVTTYFEVYRTVIETVWNAVQTVTSTVWDAVVAVLTGVWTAIKTVVSSGVEAVRDVIATIFGGISTAISGYVGAWHTAITAAWSAITSAVSGAVGAVKTAIGGLASIAGTIGGYFRSAQTAVSTAIGGIVSLAAALPGRIVSAVGNLGGLLVSAGADLLRGLANGITGAIGGVIDAAKNAAHAAVSAVKGALGINSPSRVFAELGGYVGDGFAQGIAGSQRTVGMAMRDMVDLAGLRLGGPSFVQDRLALSGSATGGTGGGGTTYIDQSVTYEVTAPGTYAEPITEQGIGTVLEQMLLLEA